MRGFTFAGKPVWSRFMRAQVSWLLVSLLGTATVASAQAPVPTEAETLRTSIGLTLIRIPAGSFMMGLGDEEVPKEIAAIFEDERPNHRVMISQAFRLGVYEVTQGEYKSVMGMNPSKFSDSDDLPVEDVSWLEAVAFCNRLSEREGRKPYYRIEKSDVTIQGGRGFRLPTEAEWEYACRAGTESTYPFDGGGDKLGEYSWCEGNSNGRTHPVGKKRPNRFGLHDMKGNVCEWCWDKYTVDYYKVSPDTDPRGPSESDLRVVRGESWTTDALLMRSAHRGRDLPESRYRYGDIGFRVAASE